MPRQIVLNNSSRQQINIVGDNGEIIPFLIYFLPTQNGWAFDVEYSDFKLNGAYLTISPNCLRGYRNILPFGISCISTDGYEPQFINDFSDGRVSLFLLNAVEAAQIETEVYG
jgi:hypothetical protein